jgi:hypothetical protein
MGIFYVNHTVRASQDRVLDILKKERRTAFVSPTIGGYTVVCDRQCDEQDPVAIAQLGQKLSALLGAPVLAVLNHDDDLFSYWLFKQGQLIEEHDAFPENVEDDDEGCGGFRLYRETEEDWNPTPEDDEASATPGEELCRILGHEAMGEQVQAVLTGCDALFARQIHQELVELLGLPSCAVGAGYKCVIQRHTELDRDECVHVGS